jgi:hypothetical protein
MCPRLRHALLTPSWYEAFRGCGACFNCLLIGGCVCQASEKEKDSNALDIPITLKTIIKMSDIGHAAKPRHLHLAWTERIGREFFAQGDMERAQGLTISPFCDRTNADLPSSQIGFFECMSCQVRKAAIGLVSYFKPLVYC